MNRYEELNAIISREKPDFSEFISLISSLLNKSNLGYKDYLKLFKYDSSCFNKYIEDFGDFLSEDQLFRLQKIIKGVKNIKGLFTEDLSELSLPYLPFSSYIVEWYPLPKIDFKYILSKIHQLLADLHSFSFKPLFHSFIKSKILALAFHAPKGNKNPPASFFSECSFIEWISFNLEICFEKKRFSTNFITRGLVFN